MVIIDIDMPKSCRECPISSRILLLCHVKKEIIDSENYLQQKRPDWCPLKEINKNGNDR